MSASEIESGRSLRQLASRARAWAAAARQAHADERLALREAAARTCAERESRRDALLPPAPESRLDLVGAIEGSGAKSGMDPSATPSHALAGSRWVAGA